MTGTSTAGADWKGTGELKALRRIVGGNEDDEDAPAPIGHNRPPQAALKLQRIFDRIELSRELSRDAVIERMREEGYTWAAIGAAVGRKVPSVFDRYRAIKAKRPRGINTAARARFATWAANKFGLERYKISVYLTLARKPERSKYGIKKLADANKLGRAILAAQKRPGVPEPLRRVFQALPIPARERWLIWAASLLIGSNNPDSIARWFATRLSA